MNAGKVYIDLRKQLATINSSRDMTIELMKEAKQKILDTYYNDMIDKIAKTINDEEVSELVTELISDYVKKHKAISEDGNI